MKPGTCYFVNPNMVERKISDEHLLVPIAGDMESLDSIFSLNPTASMIYKLAGEGLSEDAIVERIRDAYEVDESTARDDVTNTLNELVVTGALAVQKETK